MTQEKHQTRRGVILYEVSPFMPSVKTRTRRLTNKRGDMMLISNEGEIQSNIAGFWESKEVDSAQFLKLFVTGVKAFAELKNPGCRVFELLFAGMQNRPNKDTVYLSYTGLDKNEKAISRSTFARGISELIEKGFIASMPAVGWYWVNPNFIWNGDRLAFVKEYHRKEVEDMRTKRILNKIKHDKYFSEDLPQAVKEKTSPDLPFPEENE